MEATKFKWTIAMLDIYNNTANCWKKEISIIRRITILVVSVLKTTSFRASASFAPVSRGSSHQPTTGLALSHLGTPKQPGQPGKPGSCNQALHIVGLCITELVRQKGDSSLPPEGGGHSQKNWVEVWGPFPKTLTLFMAKICDFPYPYYDLTKNLIPYL